MSKSEILDNKGKNIFKSLLDQYGIIHNFTPNKYDRVDVYFGTKSVGEIKYRLADYDSYIIEEGKFTSLKKIPVQNQFYITCLDNEIYIWSTDTIQKYPIRKMYLQTDEDNPANKTWKDVRFIPIHDADYIFSRQTPTSPWELTKCF